MIPCYVSGKGMHATEITWEFKTSVIGALEQSGLGYDTRYEYYRHQYPDLASEQLARMICDPMEYYDLDWDEYRNRHKLALSKDVMATQFMLERDIKFRTKAQTAIYCFDEAGFGSGVNCVKFLMEGKPILGFISTEYKSKSLNISNILQLKAEFPELIHLINYHSIQDVNQHVIRWLQELSDNQLKKNLNLIKD